MLSVLSPVSGTAVGLSEVPDPVFAQGMVGPGTAILPRNGRQEAVAPIAGRVAKLHAHAFVVVGEGGRGVLVHLGIDTVKLNGEGFERLVDEGADVEAGQPLIRWDPAEVAAKGMATVVPVVALDAGHDVISRAVAGEVEKGSQLFQWA
ncbi:PTS sugar transporter subunit IIA [Marinactinospora thermotolerans]|uniref:PTS system, glucose-specific IIA component n=1 Tax=Marinactinospora thermotolerans DSM 45154 TaxID=1122192 RepID=A0A1T4QJJ2_9ACTN|nr:PTS glucose transporter subunit IIA [Marinactinospora thermotolerans]SKA03671.1 PTS system, glucose-specific IIA component [Marinactinospora thermotolerans DSM 45154]